VLIGTWSLSRELEFGWVVVSDARASTESGGSRHCTHFTHAIRFVRGPEHHELKTLLTTHTFPSLE